MTDRPISFKAPMIRALLAGTKSQTRRLLKPQPKEPTPDNPILLKRNKRYALIHDGERAYVYPAIKVEAEDRFWVKEAWRAQEYFDDMSPSEIGTAFTEERGDPYAPVFYEATKSCDGSSIDQWQESELGRLRASMHMPRWASRLTLIVTDVRVERLQDISEDDAIAEGIEGAGVAWRDYLPAPNVTNSWFADPRHSYASLWNHINGAGAWESNPWIVAYSFTVHHCNIDQLETI